MKTLFVLTALLMPLFTASLSFSEDAGMRPAGSRSNLIFHPSIMNYPIGKGPRHFDAWHQTPPAGAPAQPYLPYTYQDGRFIYWRKPDYSAYWQSWKEPHYKWQPDIAVSPHTINRTQWINVDWYAFDRNETYRNHVEKLLRNGYRMRNPR